MQRGGGRHSPFPEFRAIPGALRATPAADVVDVETGRVHSFVPPPPRLLPWFSWADDVEEEEAKKEHERRAREKVVKERVERKEMKETQAARELAYRQRAEKVRMEMERLKRVRAETERREKERAARREAEERESALFAEREIARRKAEREESLEKERVGRTTGGKEERERTGATYSVASVSGPFPIINEVELERDQCRRQGAIPKRLATRSREERNSRPSPVDSPASPDGKRGGEEGATSEEERSSRSPVSPRRKPVALPGTAPAVAALAVAPTHRTGRAEGAYETWRQERRPRVQQRSPQRSETPRERRNAVE